MKVISLTICDELYEYARRYVQGLDGEEPEEYLNGLLNMALLHEMNEHEGLLDIQRPSHLVMSCPEDRRLIERLEENIEHDPREHIEEDPGGGMRLKDDRSDDDDDHHHLFDPDEEIPF